MIFNHTLHSHIRATQVKLACKHLINHDEIDDSKTIINQKKRVPRRLPTTNNGATTNSKVKPYVNIGPQIGFALYGDSNDHDLDNDQLKDAEFALAFGGGVNLPVASSPDDFIQTVGLDLRYIRF